MTLVTRSVTASILATCRAIRNEVVPWLTPHFDILRSEPMRLIVELSALEVFSQHQRKYSLSVFGTIVAEAIPLMSGTSSSSRFPTYVFGRYIFGMASPIYHRIKDFVDRAVKALSQVQHIIITIVIDPAAPDVLAVGFRSNEAVSVQAWASALDTLTPEKSCALMYKPGPSKYVHEARLANLHGGLQGSGAVHFGTRYRIINLPTLENWEEDWGESAILVPPQPEAQVVETGEQEIEDAGQPDEVVQLNEEQLNEEQLNEEQLNKEQPEGTKHLEESGPSEVTGVVV
jgi:hypothetical protein